MQAHLLQFNISWENRHENFDRVRALLDRTPVNRGDFILLPELFDSGFSLNVASTADNQDETDAFLRDLARATGCTLQGGRTHLPPGADLAYNEAPIFSPSGDGIARYRKVHPFTFGREPESFQGGGSIVTYAWHAGDRSLKVCPAVCYDLRFPELFRAGLHAGAEMFAIGANWPNARQAHWRALLIARAIENQAFVLGVNRTGDDPFLSYLGGSIAVGPKGDVLAELTTEEAVLSVEIDPSEVAAWREKFPAWRDGRVSVPDGAVTPAESR